MCYVCYFCPLCSSLYFFNRRYNEKSPRNLDKARARHMLNERRKFQDEDRQRAKRWERERVEREQEELEEEMRLKTIPSTISYMDSG